MKKVMVTVCMAVLFAAGTARADLAVTGAIAYWNQQGQTGQQAWTPGTGSSNITAINMTRGAGLLTDSTGANSLNSNGWTGEATDYIQFGLTIDPGYTANLNQLVIATRSSAYGPGTMSLYGSADNFATQTQIATFTQGNATYLNSTVDLSGLQGITGTYLFRLEEVGTNAANGSTTTSAGTFRVSDYNNAGIYYYDSITGSVTPTPIPAAAWLFGSGLAGLIGLRRKAK
jgi:hypothetical protein